jgi:polysaccharide chain length determinant protein (PEP-CTERM system associated)
MQQIKEYERRLDEAADRVKRFKQENMGLMGGGEGYFGKREAQRAQIREALLQLEEAEKRREEIARKVEEIDQYFDGDDLNAPVTGHPLDARIESLEASVDQMLLRYTEHHPDVVSTRNLIADLKRERQEALSQAQASGGGGSGQRQRVENPLYQQLSLALGNAEAEVAALRARVDEYKRREQQLSEMVDKALEVEAEEGRLNRDYNTIKSNHETLVTRLESLNLSDEVAKSSDAFKFNVIEPPRMPTKPSSPKRPALNVLVLALGLGSGAGVAWLLAMFRPAMYSREGFAEFTDIPVLGSISRVMSGAEVREHRFRIALFAAAGVTLIAGFGITLVFESQLISGLSSLRDLAVQVL